VGAVGVIRACGVMRTWGVVGAHLTGCAPSQAPSTNRVAVGRIST
jgi:hypothetical protein